MKDENYLLKAFDTERHQLFSNAGIETRQLIEDVAGALRLGLVHFYNVHSRLPKTVQELVDSRFAIPEFRVQIEAIRREYGPFDVFSFPVKVFLARTQDVVDGDRRQERRTEIALKLVHAVYRSNDQFSHWKRAAEKLTKQGFTDEQICLLRSDIGVRRACRKLLRPYHRGQG